MRRRADTDEESGSRSSSSSPAAEDDGFSMSDLRADCWAESGFYTVICLVAAVQGASNLSSLAVSYYFKDDLKLSPAQSGLALSMTAVPWTLKPLYGFLSDSYPIGGLRRAPYLFLFGLVGFLAWMAMATLVGDVYSAVLVLLTASLSVAFVNVLAEALIVEKGGDVGGHVTRVKGKVSKLVTLFWGTQSVFRIASGFTSGVLLERVPKADIFALTGLFPLLLVFVAYRVHERPATNPNPVREQMALLLRHLAHPYIWRPALFMFLWQATPSSSSAYFYFLTSDIKLNPEFLGALSVVEGVSSLLGLALYNGYLTQTPYRKILKWTVALGFVAGLTPLVLITHANRRMGIADRWFTLGDTALLAGVGQVGLMPLLVLGAQTCPKAVEGTLYALLMSTLNVGGLVADGLGALLTWALGITSTNFDNLWILVVICSVCNLLPIPLLRHLVPSEEELEVFHRDYKVGGAAGAGGGAEEEEDDEDEADDEARPLLG